MLLMKVSQKLLKVVLMLQLLLMQRETLWIVLLVGDLMDHLQEIWDQDQTALHLKVIWGQEQMDQMDLLQVIVDLLQVIWDRMDLLQVKVDLLQETWLDQVDQEIWDQVDQVDQEIWDQVDQEIWDQVDQVDQEIWDQVDQMDQWDQDQMDQWDQIHYLVIVDQQVDHLQVIQEDLLQEIL